VIQRRKMLIRAVPVDVVRVELNNGNGRAFWIFGEGTSREIGAGVYFGKLEGAPDVAPVKFVHIK